MNIKKIVIIFIILLGLSVFGFWFIKKPVNVQESNLKQEEIIGVEIIYVDISNNQQLKVLYNKDLDIATIYPNESGQVVFNATTSASGARYDNSNQGLILWNKDDEVSLYLNDSLIFSGVDIKKKIQ